MVVVQEEGSLDTGEKGVDRERTMLIVSSTRSLFTQTSSPSQGRHLFRAIFDILVRCYYNYKLSFYLYMKLNFILLFKLYVCALKRDGEEQLLGCTQSDGGNQPLPSSARQKLLL